MDEPEDTVTPTLEVTPLKDSLSTVRFEGDSWFDEFWEQGGAASDQEVAQYPTSLVKENISLGDLLFGCSTLSAANASGGCLFGRNFDWEPCNAMIVQSAPENGYKSISTDNTGRSVVVEYINNEMVVVETPVVTNFYLARGKKRRRNGAVPREIRHLNGRSSRPRYHDHRRSPGRFGQRE